MICLASTETIEVLLSGAVATNECVIGAAWIDTNGTLGGDIKPTNGATAVTLAPAPASGLKRLLKSLWIHNADTASITVTFRLNQNGGTYRRLVTLAVGVNQTLLFSPEAGWVVGP